MPDYPKVSVIIPARNEEEYIEECLKSIITQDYPRNKLEIIVVDGASQDNTKKIIHEIASKIVKVVVNPKKITSSALNLGVKKSSGDIKIIFGAHATMAKAYIRNCVIYLKKTGADCVGGRIYSVAKTNKGKAIATIMNSKLGGSESRYMAKESYLKTLSFGAYKKGVFDKICLFDESLIRSQDCEFNFRLVKSGGKLFMTPKIKAKYYCRESFKRLFKQFLDYGYHKIIVLKRHPQFIKPKHLVPFFVLLLIPLFFINNFYLFLIPLYFLLLFFQSLIISYKKLRNVFFIFYGIFIIHLSYTLGNLYSLLTGKLFR